MSSVWRVVAQRLTVVLYNFINSIRVFHRGANMARELYFSQDDPDSAQGFRNILATESVHNYVAAWWPPGHIIGYEHEFHHAVFDFLKAIDTHGTITPNFA